MNIQGSVDWSTVIGAFVAVSTALLSIVSLPIAEYMGDRRNRNSWENILKEIEVFNRWVDEGRLETIDRLYYHIEESINERFNKRHFPVHWFFSLAAAFLEIWYFITALTNHRWLLGALSVLSLLCVVLSVMLHERGSYRREVDRKARVKAQVKAEISEMASHIGDAQAEEEKLVRLERNNDVDARWVAYLSRGSVYNRRVISEYRHAAREKAEDMELERLVDQVMQLPEELSADEE